MGGSLAIFASTTVLAISDGDFLVAVCALLLMSALFAYFRGDRYPTERSSVGVDLIDYVIDGVTTVLSRLLPRETFFGLLLFAGAVIVYWVISN